jgi:integrase
MGGMATKRATDRITKRLVDAIQPPPVGLPPVEIWDAEVKGLHVRMPSSGRAVYRFWYRSGGTQKVVTLGAHGVVTAEQARDRARALAGAVAEGRDPTAERKAARQAALEEERRAVSVAELVERWLVEGRDAAPSKRESSWDTDARKLRRHIVPLLGRVQVRSLTKDDIAQAQRAIAAGRTAIDEKTENKRGRAIVRGGAGVARSAIMSLSACLTWAVDQEIIAANPVARVKKLPKRTMERYLSEVEVARLLETLTRMETDGSLLPVHADCIRVLILTGARRGEIAGLRWDEVDLQRGLLTLGAGRHKTGGSSGKKHIVLNAPAAQVIAERPHDTDFVFPAPVATDQGCGASLQKAWERVRARADLANTRLHDLRHTWASFGAAGGASLLLIQKALGHTNAATTSRYAHLGADPVRDLAERIGERIMGTLQTVKEKDAPDNVVAMPSTEWRKIQT